MDFLTNVKREKLQWLLTPLVPAVVIGGYFWPYLGFIAIGMLALMVGLTFLRGRYYCGWFCAMGAFHERILARISRNRNMLPLFKSTWFRVLIFMLMMGLLLTRLIMSKGDPALIGAVFVMMWTIATGIAVGLGIFFNPKSWCSFCPMGTMQALLAPKTYLLAVADDCRQCGYCSQFCPIETNPGTYKNTGYVRSIECMRCARCIENCPKGALTFKH